mmetsp:Transcript_62479/g.148800  ORF Transcript_62479/g.148800 Transcript_62479/m.148800 type:complete len:315 (+) Transcript_62479:1301-2245(+)
MSFAKMIANGASFARRSSWCLVMTTSPWMKSRSSTSDSSRSTWLPAPRTRLTRPPSGGVGYSRAASSTELSSSQISPVTPIPPNPTYLSAAEYGYTLTTASPVAVFLIGRGLSPAAPEACCSRIVVRILRTTDSKNELLRKLSVTRTVLAIGAMSSGRTNPWIAVVPFTHSPRSTFFSCDSMSSRYWIFLATGISAHVFLLPSRTRSFSVISACTFSVNFKGASLKAPFFAVTIPIFNRPGAPDLTDLLEAGGASGREAALAAANLAGGRGAANAAAPESDARTATRRNQPDCMYQTDAHTLLLTATGHIPGFP